jgi:Ca2+-binding RTX toxin-like protein
MPVQPPRVMVSAMFTAPGVTMKSLKLLLAVAAFAVLALPAVASAATISYDSSGALNYQADSGERNYFGFYKEGSRLAVSDSGASSINYPAGVCEPGWVSYVVVCDMPTAIKASLDDQNDIADGSKEITIPQTFDGGAGPDTLRHDAFAPNSITLRGGPGDDKVTGGAGPDVLEGGDGVDELTGRDSADQIYAGPGNDKLLGDAVNVDRAADVLDGGDGVDTIEGDWSKNLDEKERLNVTLGGGADDGRPGENDDLRSVEKVVTNSAGTYSGSEGADDIDINQVTESSTVNGNGGDDRLDLSDADDTIDGGAGVDRIEGGYGNDTITGGPGADALFGDEPQGECSYIYCKPPSGNDTINARDGEADTVDCGVGPADVANVDAIDNVQGCETVNREADDNNGPIATEMTAKFGKVKLRKALKSGVPVTITGPGPGKVTLKARRGKKVVATGSGKVSAQGVAKLKLKFNKAGKKALKRAKSAKLTVDVTFKPAGGDAVTGQTKLTLKR